MSKTSVFHAVNSCISAITAREHLKVPKTAYRMIVDERANLIVCWTKSEYQQYIESRDKELCTY